MNYHDRSEADIYAARILISPVGNPTYDEGIYDIAAYHVQQAIEKELKYLLHDIYGADDNSRSFRTHDLSDVFEKFQ